MKNLIFIFTLASLFNATTQDVVTLSQQPSGFVLDGSTLYFGKYNGSTISKIDIAQTGPAIIDVITPINGRPESIAKHGNFIYVSTFNTVNGALIRFDSSATSPTFTTILQGGSFQLYSGLEVFNDELYFIFNDAIAGIFKIQKIDLTQSSPVPVDVVTGLSTITDLEIKGNDLYILEAGANKISKIDLTSSSFVPLDIINALPSSSNRMVINGSTLFLTSGNTTLSSYDLTQSIPSQTIISSILSSPRDIEVYNNYIFIGEFQGQKISKIDLSTLGNDTVANEDLQIVENPTDGILKISGFKKPTNFTLYDINGKKILHGVIMDKTLDISGVTTGFYLLKLENTKTIKILKK